MDVEWMSYSDSPTETSRSTAARMGRERKKMKVVDIKFQDGKVSLLCMFGFGGGYQTNRMWHCSSLADAIGADISEVHEEWATMDPYFARLVSRLQEGGFLRRSDAQYAYEPYSAQAVIAHIAAALGIPKKFIGKKLPEKCGLEEIIGRVLAAAKSALRAALAA